MARTSLAVGLLLAAVSFSGCGAGSPQAAPAEPPHPADLLLIIDLSSSLTVEQRLRIPDLATPQLSRAGSHVAVYPLQTDLGNAAPIISADLPAVVTTADEIRLRNKTLALKDQLQKAIDAALHPPKKPVKDPWTSCYIKSAAFAAQYFARARAGSSTELVWIGDMIEDCPDPAYRSYRLSRQTFPPAMDNLRSLRPVDGIPAASVSSVRVTAVILPRILQEGDREVDFDHLRTYWSHVMEKFGFSAEHFLIGTPELLQRQSSQAP
jgi:hypothetical protein